MTNIRTYLYIMYVCSKRNYPIKIFHCLVLYVETTKEYKTCQVSLIKVFFCNIVYSKLSILIIILYDFNII